MNKDILKQIILDNRVEVERYNLSFLCLRTTNVII